ncbi:hypothetical protein AKJ16_DCAP08602 [Drosera capensis]
MRMEEKIGHDGIPMEPCAEFENCCLSCGLEDIRSFGPLYTWCNNQASSSWMRINVLGMILGMKRFLLLRLGLWSLEFLTTLQFWLKFHTPILVKIPSPLKAIERHASSFSNVAARIDEVSKDLESLQSALRFCYSEKGKRVMLDKSILLCSLLDSDVEFHRQLVND